jgi:hypothetical protein
MKLVNVGVGEKETATRRTSERSEVLNEKPAETAKGEMRE